MGLSTLIKRATKTTAKTAAKKTAKKVVVTTAALGTTAVAGGVLLNQPAIDSDGDGSPDTTPIDYLTSLPAQVWDGVTGVFGKHLWILPAAGVVLVLMLMINRVPKRGAVIHGDDAVSDPKISAEVLRLHGKQ